MKVFIDIETIPTQNSKLIKLILKDLTAPKSYKKQETIEKWFEENKEKAITKTSFDGGKGEVCTISWAVGDGEIQSIQRTGFEGMTELELLNKFYLDLSSVLLTSDNSTIVQPYFIAHNKEFDLRFLFLRNVILQANTKQIRIHASDRYDNHSFCTMNAWSGFYPKDGGSLESICQVLGIKCKEGDMDGSKVWPAYQNCEYDKIEAYCRDDVNALREVYGRLINYI